MILIAHYILFFFIRIIDQKDYIFIISIFCKYKFEHRYL